MQEKVLNDIKVTMAAEGMFITKQDENIIEEYYNGKITEQEGIEIIKNRFKKDGGCVVCMIQLIQNIHIQELVL